MKPILKTTLLASTLPFMAQAQEKPNIIVFLIDDMGVMDTSVEFLTNNEGQLQRHPLNDWYKTPSMEKLAQEGVRFSRFYAQSVSSPSRTSILTGQNSTRHRTTNWIDFKSNNRTKFGPMDWNWEGIKKDDITLPKLLNQAGYKTIHIGKAHYGPTGSEGENPCDIGFDINIGGSSIGHPGSYYGEDGYGHIKGDKTRAVNDLEKYHGTDTFLSEALTLEAKKAINDAVENNEPFYLNFSHYAVHAPFQEDKRFIDNYPESSGKSKFARAYATLIEGMDKSLGDIMNHLEKLDIADNTLLIFLGDNGSDAPLGDKDAHFSSAPLRGKKGTIYEGGVRIPFIAAWVKNDINNPNQKKFTINKNEVVSKRANIMDIFPTILELADINNPKNHIVDGSQLWKLFKGKNDSSHSSDILLHFPHGHNGSYFSSYIEDDWKVIYHYNPENPTNPKYELYNLSSDPYENNDLSSIEKDKLSSIMSNMASKLREEGAQPPINAEGNSLFPIIP